MAAQSFFRRPSANERARKKKFRGKNKNPQQATHASDTGWWTRAGLREGARAFFFCSRADCRCKAGCFPALLFARE
jgi:hypothetical protein